MTDEETNWSINLKRAILSMLQVRMEEEKPSQYNSVVKDNLEKYNATSFNVQEVALLYLVKIQFYYSNLLPKPL